MYVARRLICDLAGVYRSVYVARGLLYGLTWVNQSVLVARRLPCDLAGLYLSV